MKFAEYNEDFGRNEFGRAFEKEATQMTALQSLLTVNELPTVEVPLLREFKYVKEFLDLPMNDDKEAILKKLFATSIIIAKNKGVLPFAIDMSPETIATTVDDALTRLKIAYKTGCEVMDDVEAVDALVDAAAVRAMAITDRVIEKGMPVIIDKLCMALSKKPETIPVAFLIKKSERFITEKTKVVVRKGINVLKNIAKPILKETIVKVKSIGAKVMNFLKA